MVFPLHPSSFSSPAGPPIVALGGSAGSFDAINEFFSLVPADSGLAFIVVVHLSPQHESHLPEILARRSGLKVEHARDAQPIEANRVYVIPPGRALRVSGGRLHLADLYPQRGVRSAIDLLFTSLAKEGEGVAAILLSGADSDGTIGLGCLKASGALTLVQDPLEALHDLMPTRAIESGSADAVLRVADMPARVLAHFGSSSPLRVPSRPDVALVETKPLSSAEESLVRDVTACLHERTGQDFSSYRATAFLRRLTSRMQIVRAEAPRDYLEFMRGDAREAHALAHDLLVSVTSFFRDPQSFAILERHLPALFAGKGPADFVRVWVPACATGEEAYSIAMLLLEHASRLEDPPRVQVFGCDLDPDAIEVARRGHYPERISAQLSEERLRRFFTREARGLRVRRELRQVLLFAVHDVVKDSAFARMDLVSCRNLLIYFKREVQKRLVEVFHFALGEGGLLFLGRAETIDAESAHFETLDPDHRIYRHRPMPQSEQGGRAGALLRALQVEERARRDCGGEMASRPVAAYRPPAAPLAQATGSRDAVAAPELEQALRASNQELQATNEELRAASEELEVNRQELQSINEELHAVNQELSVNLDELARANTDLRNLMNATAIATIFLDPELRIMRFTPAAVGIFRFIPADVGRPLAHLRHQLEYSALLEDARRVAQSSEAVEKEVRDTEGRWFLARVLPYRTPDEAIAGVVLTFVDIAERKRAEEALRRSGQQMRWQKEALLAAVNGAPLGESLSLLGRVMSDESDGEVRTAFYIENGAGARSHSVPGAADMPESYMRQMDGFAVDDIPAETHSLACGLAIAQGNPVLTSDVFAEPLWRPWAHLAEQFGFRACWSFPIKTRDSTPVGSFTLYFRNPREPAPYELALADVVTECAAIIISHWTEAQERARAEVALQARNDELERIQQATAGHERRMMELEREIRALRAERREGPRDVMEPDADRAA